jgi:two-component system NtrC family sensor kinase
MNSIRILYVEDDHGDQELTRRHLERSAPHLKLTIAGTVGEALDRLAVGDIDVVLSDYRLPDGSGLDLLEAVKVRDLRMPVVLVTGSGDAESAVRLLKAGAADYVVKRGNYLATLPAVVEGAYRWSRSTSELRRTPLRLLYAEDDRGATELTVRAFREHDPRIVVDTVSTARDALAGLKAAPYDLLLVDYRLPDLSGIEVLKELRAERLEVPVVMITGRGDEETAVQAFKLGVADYLIKQEGYVAKLPSTVENVLAQRRLADEKDALVVLNHLARSLVTIKDVEEVLSAVIEAGRELVKADASLLWLFESGMLRPVAWTGIEAADERTLWLSADPALAERLATERRISLGQLSRATSGAGPPVGVAATGQTLAVSLVGPQGLLGVLAVVSHRPREFEAADERLLLALADYAAVAIENARLYRELKEELESRTRLTAILEATSDLVGIADASGRLLYLNRAGRALLGIGPDEPPSRYRPEEFAPEHFRVAVREEVLPIIIRDGLWKGEGALLSRDGREVPVSIVAIAHRTASGAIEFLSTIARDITELREAEAALQRQREALYQTEKLATMGSILAGVAHELNNPLSVVTGHAALLGRALAGTPDAERARKIGQAADRCARIVKNFLALARQYPPERRRVALNDAVTEAVELFAYQFRLDNVQVVLDLAVDLPVLWADPHQLHQVVVNLISNAHHAVREMPTRQLALRTVDDRSRGRVVLEVADTGPGVPAEIRRQIFEPFFTTKPVGQGTGLGLSLCLGIVESHGGRLSLESGPDVGARFRVDLPVVVPPVAAADRPPGEPAEVITGKRILVVDDEPQVLEVLADFLGTIGHHVETAGDGAAALEKILASRCDAILSDVRMPVLDGPGLYRELAGRAPELSRRFVLITGDVLSPETRTFLKETGVPSLTKPFDFDEIQRVLRRVLEA